jgi:hypothetical protein
MPPAQKPRTIEIPYYPRPHFRAFHERKTRYFVSVSHRRAGKTVACINDLIKGACTTRRQAPRFAYVAPLRNQAKAVAWDYLKHYSRSIPGIKINESELRIDYPNGGQVRLYGADDPDQMRGLYFDGVVLDEYAQMHPRLFSSVVQPCLGDRQGWCVFIGTPMGRNAFCELYEGARDGFLREQEDGSSVRVKDPAWGHMMLKASQSGILSPEELASQARSKTPEEYAQEFECSFEAAIMGAYYGRIMSKLEADGRLCKLNWDPKTPVMTAWDLGHHDSTAIWFAQMQGNEIRLIDYYESSGVGAAHYAAQLLDRKNRDWVFSDHILPFDASVEDWGTGKSRVETLWSFGIKCRILPKEWCNPEEGINEVRGLLPRCRFDTDRCSRGIEALRQYRTEYDEKLGAFRARPLHDWTSHAADAFRYLAMGIGPAFKPKKERDSMLRRVGSWMSA